MRLEDAEVEYGEAMEALERTEAAYREYPDNDTLREAVIGAEEEVVAAEDRLEDAREVARLDGYAV